MSDLLFVLSLLLGVFLVGPGLIAWLVVALQGWMLRRMGRNNASKMVLTIEFLFIIIALGVITTIVGRSMLVGIPAPA